MSDSSNMNVSPDFCTTKIMSQSFEGQSHEKFETRRRESRVNPLSFKYYV